MTTATLPVHALPLKAWASGSLMRRAAVVLAGSWVIAASAWITVPMFPVPMTMQTFAVLLIAVLAGPRLAAETVAAYLLQGALGAPVFAGGAAGAVHLMGPTGGYLAGFLAGAALAGWMAETFGRGLVALFAAALAGHALIFAAGVAQLGLFVGIEQAVVTGVVPFLVGTLVKSALVAASARAALARR